MSSHIEQVDAFLDLSESLLRENLAVVANAEKQLRGTPVEAAFQQARAQARLLHAARSNRVRAQAGLLRAARLTRQTART